MPIRCLKNKAARFLKEDGIREFLVKIDSFNFLIKSEIVKRVGYMLVAG